MRFELVISSNFTADQLFEFLADFENTTIWDPGTVQTKKIYGDGTLGSKYENISKFLGKETTLNYETTQYQYPNLVQFTGRNNTVTAIDTLIIAPSQAGATLTYRAEFIPKSSWLTPIMYLPLRWLVRSAKKSLTFHLNQQ